LQCRLSAVAGWQGRWRFADGFAGAVKEPGRAAFRPSGLAMGPDGALYISEDVHGRIWRVTYHGPRDAAPAAATVPNVAGVTAGESGPPEGSRRRPHCRGVTAGARGRHRRPGRLGRTDLPR